MLTVLFNLKYQWSIISVFIECFITGFVRRVTRRVLLVEQEQITVPELLCSRPVFSGFRHTGFNYPFGIFKFFLALVVSYMYNSLIPWLYQLTIVTPCWWIIVHIPVFVGLSYCCFIIFTVFILDFRTVLRGYQRSYQKLYIEVEQTMQWSKEETKEQTTIYKRSHRKLKIEQHESHQTSGEKSGVQEG